jgi:hypothetical protein
MLAFGPFDSEFYYYEWMEYNQPYILMLLIQFNSKFIFILYLYKSLIL